MTGAAHQLSTRLFIGSSGLADLRDAWGQLAHRCGGHFVNYPYWYEAKLCSEPELSEQMVFVAVYQQGQLRAVFPLLRNRLHWRGLNLHYVELAYSNEMGVCDIVSELALPDMRKALLAALDGLTERPHFLRCQQYLAGHHLHSAHVQALATFTKPSHYSKYLQVGNDYAAFRSRYSGKFLRNLRRLRRKAQSLGELTFTTYRAPDELAAAFDTFVEVEGKGWKGERGTNIGTLDRQLKFYRTLLERFGADGLCQINLLHLNDKCLAGQFTLRINGEVSLLKIGFDESMSELSPGMLILDYLTEYVAHQTDLGSISFVTGTEWMERWKPQRVTAYLSYVPTRPITGRLLAKLLALRNFVRGSSSMPGRN